VQYAEHGEHEQQRPDHAEANERGRIHTNMMGRYLWLVQPPAGRVSRNPTGRYSQ
jgi:hypothetical protein